MKILLLIGIALLVLHIYRKTAKISKAYEIYENLINLENEYLILLEEGKFEGYDNLQNYFSKQYLSDKEIAPIDLIDKEKLPIVKSKNSNMPLLEELIKTDLEIRNLFFRHQKELKRTLWLQQPLKYFIMNTLFILKSTKYRIKYKIEIRKAKIHTNKTKVQTEKTLTEKVLEEIEKTEKNNVSAPLQFA